MKTNVKIISAALTLLFALTMLLSGAPQSTAHNRTASLVGAWRMTSLEVGTEGNLQPIPYSGQIVFTKAGTMSVQARNPDPDAPDTAYTVNGYEAFYGTYRVSRSQRSFVVTVESSVAPNLVGQQLTRVFKVTGNTLVLTPADPAEGFRVTYERI